jgi:hypothetical protein
MAQITDVAPQGRSHLARGWSGMTLPFRSMWTTAEGLLGETLQEVKASPMTWTAILVLAGTVSFIGKSYHVGTVLVSAVGILWMWQDMREGAAKAADDEAIAVVV